MKTVNRSPSTVHRILITGSNGFIGSHLVENALKQGFKVIAAIRSSSNLKYLDGLPIQYLNLDLSNPTILTQQLSEFKAEFGQVDYIVHNAGVTKAKSKETYLKVNATYTQHLLDAIEQSQILKQQFLLMSSLAARGPAEKMQPVTFYGESKLAAEQIVRQSNIPYLIFRPTAVYGPRDKDFQTMFDTLKSKLELYVGYQTQQLSFIYVKDLTQLILTALQSDKTQKIYNVAAHPFYTTKDFNQILKQILKVKTISIKLPIALVRYIAYIAAFFSNFTGEYPILNPNKVNELASLDWRCDITDIEQDFNFKPQYSLEMGLKETLEGR